MSKKTAVINTYLFMGMFLGALVRLAVVGLIFYVTVNSNSWWIVFCGPAALFLFFVHGIATTFVVGKMYKQTPEEGSKWFAFIFAFAPLTTTIVVALALMAGVSLGMTRLG